jgi:hypothetical protein
MEIRLKWKLLILASLLGYAENQNQHLTKDDIWAPFHGPSN